MKIVKLTAENLKRIKAVDIELDDDAGMVVISGRNAQGKTSVLDAIWLALGGGTAAKSTSRPIRDGETTATVTLDLGDYRVTRTWTADGKSKLTVTAPDGAKYSSPQAILDGLVGALSFDPLAFTNASAKDQVATLLNLVDLPFNLDELAENRQRVFAERTDVNRDIKALQAQIDGIPTPDPDLPDEEISVTDLIAQIDTEREANINHAAAVEHLEHVRRLAIEAEANVEEARQALAAAEKHLTQCLSDARTVKQSLERTPKSTRLEELTAQLQTVEPVNTAIRQAQHRNELTVRLNNLQDTAAELTGQLEAIDQTKADGLANAAMPIDGLSFDDQGVTYQGVPFAQCSAAEQLRVSIAMAMALNPQLRVIRILDGSLLDSTNLRIIEEMATAGDYQIWIEMVDESGQLGIVIEDGEIAQAKAAAA